MFMTFYWRFYSSGIREDCNNWVTKCDECAKVKDPQRKPHVPFAEMPVCSPIWTDHPQIFWAPSQSLLKVIIMY